MSDLIGELSTPSEFFRQCWAPHDVRVHRSGRKRLYFAQPAGLPALPGLSHAVAFSGRQVIVSGQVPLNAAGEFVGEDVEAQLRQVFTNVSNALVAAGAEMKDVVKLTVFLTDIADAAVYRTVRDQFVDTDNPPASSLFQVGALINPKFRAEIEALAVI